MPDGFARLMRIAGSIAGLACLTIIAVLCIVAAIP